MAASTVHGAIAMILTDPVGTGQFAGATGRLFVHADTRVAVSDRATGTIPVSRLEAEGYGDFRKLFDEQ